MKKELLFWEIPKPLYNRITKSYEHLPICWVHSRPATNKDINDLFEYYGRPVDYDHRSLVGTDSDDYTTSGLGRLKLGGYTVYGWTRWKQILGLL